MKLLFDENLSRKLVARLSDVFPGSKHVADVDLLRSLDPAIWEFAKSGGWTIVSTDADFFEMATAYGPPPHVVWLRQWRHPTRAAESLLRRNAIRIAQFCEDSEAGLLILDSE